MKVIRVPWIRCRADEIGTCSIEVTWQKQTFHLIAYSEREAQEWWGSLSAEERDQSLGLEAAPEAEEGTFW